MRESPPRRDRDGEIEHTALPAGGLGLPALRLRALSRGHDLRVQFGILRGPLGELGPTEREMRIDVCAGQAHAEIIREGAPRTAVVEDAVQDEITGLLAIVRKLPVPPHRRDIPSQGNPFASNGIGNTEVPQRQRLATGPSRFLFVDSY